MCAVPSGTAVGVARPQLELADIIRHHGDAYRRTHRLTSGQHRALRAIAACRTAALGGHRETCDRCGATQIAYNSCRNRHCPKCQAVTKERWLAARTGLEPTAIWEWGVIERVSTGLLGTKIGLQPVAREMLAVADRVSGRMSDR